MKGETCGLEVLLEFRPVKWWHLSGTWSFLEMDLTLKDEKAADLTEYTEQTSPQHQWSLHSALDIGRQVSIDFRLRHVDGIRHMRPRNAMVPELKTIDGYTRFDARLAWKHSTPGWPGNRKRMWKWLLRQETLVGRTRNSPTMRLKSGSFSK